MVKNLTIIGILIIVVQITVTLNTNRLIPSNQLIHYIKKQNGSKTTQKRLLAETKDTLNKFKVAIDVSQLESIKTGLTDGQNIYALVLGKAVASVIRSLEETFQVYATPELDLTGVNKCHDFDLSHLDGDQVAAQLVVSFHWEFNKAESYVAYASPCYSSRETGRAVVGIVNLNLAYSKINKENFFENEFSTILHEIHHIFGISSSVYSKFWDRENQKFREEATVYTDSGTGHYKKLVKTQNVINWGKTQYDCPTLEGMPLENSGGSGSAGAHWDKFIVGNDMMNPTDYFNVVNSGLNMAFVDDMELYKASYTMEEYLPWGKDAGCDIFNGACSSNPMTCTENAQICSPGGYSVGKCSADIWSENCPMFHETSFGDCRLESNQENLITSGKNAMYFGNGGRCVEGRISLDQSDQQGNCLKLQCASLKSLSIQVGSEFVTCTDEDVGLAKLLTSPAGAYLICPDPAKICLNQLNCPNDCNHKGRCLKSGRCWCYQGHKGSDCGEIDEVEYEFIFAHIWILKLTHLWLILALVFIKF